MLDPELPLSEAVTNMIGSRARLNHFTYLDEGLGFIYFSVPVVANVRTAGSLLKGVAQVEGRSIDIPNMKPIFERKNGLISTPGQVGIDVFDQMLEDESVIKFTFVRDPVERFSAVYRNQFSINTKQGAQRVKLFEHLGISLEENLSIVDLAEILTEEEGIYDISPQLMPQRRMIAYDLVEYDFIGRHERWEEDFPAIAMEIFGCETPLFDPLEALNKDPEGTKLAANVNEETRRAIEEAYAQDFEMITEIEELFPDGFAAE